MTIDLARRRAVFGLTGLVTGLALSGCDAPATGQSPANAATQGATPERQVADVTDALFALGPGVDRGEAGRAARIAVHEPLRWARDWQVVDPPLVHNLKVVHGLREKGVCRDWATALYAALRAERFRTLRLHIGIANARNVSLEHVSVIATAVDQPMREGLLLDPWRIGQGRLWFGRVAEDPRYSTWESAQAVQAWTAEWRARARAGG